MWSDLIFGSLSAVLLTAVLLAIGERIRLLLRMPCSSSLRAPVAWGLGSWSLGMAILLLGLAGLFRPIPLVMVVVVAAAAGRWSGVFAPTKRLLGYALAGSPLIFVALAPPFFYDAWVYHLGLPWQALQDGVLRAHPGNLFSTFPPLAQLIYAVPLSIGAVRAPALIHLLGYCAAAVAAQGLASRLGAPRGSAWLVGVCVLYLPVAPLIPGLPAAEAWTVCGILTAVALVLTGRAGPKNGLMAGWMAGIAAASRIQGVSWVPLSALLIFARRRKPLPSLVANAAAAIIGAAPWWLKNTVLLRDPFAPLGWHRPGIETLWRDAKSNWNLAESLPDLDHRLLASLAGKAWLLVPLLVAGLLAAVTRKRPPALVLAGIASAGALGWALTGALDRFLAPSVVLLLTAAVCGRRWARVILVFPAIGLTLLPGVSSALGMFRQIGGLSVIGAAPEMYPVLLVSNPYPGFLASARLPEGSRVLFVAEPRGFLFPRRFETTSQHDPTPLADLLQRRTSPEAVRAGLVASGFTHLLVNVAEMHRLGKNYPVLPWTTLDGQAAFVALTRHLAPPALLLGEMVVYALNPKSTSKPTQDPPAREGSSRPGC